MQVPAWLRDAIDEIASEVPFAELSRAATELSEAYRAGDFARAPINTAARRAAYLAQRLPATYAACRRVFEEAEILAPHLQPRSLLDLGAGPGTATLACLSVWPSLEQASLLERDAALVAIAERLLSAAPDGRRVKASFVTGDISSWNTRGPEARADIVVASYLAGELRKQDQQAFLREAWDRTAQMFILIEPGTQRGFANVLAARDALASLDARIVAPCPRSDAHACAMAAANDWCHFSQRVERTSLHRRLKGGDLGYEDEKFSYVVFSREAIPNATARIVRHPMHFKGHIELKLCTPHGIERVTIGKKNKDTFRAARRADWGDPFPVSDFKTQS